VEFVIKFFRKRAKKTTHQLQEEEFFLQANRNSAVQKIPSLLRNLKINGSALPERDNCSP